MTRAANMRAEGMRRRAFAAGGDAYAVGGVSPKEVADFVGSAFRVKGSPSTFASMFTFARASDAYFRGSDGNLAAKTSGQARDAHHVGAAPVLGGLLLEGVAATNEFIRSEEFDNAAWVKTTNTTVTANQATAPDGATAADEIGTSTTGTAQGVSQGVTVTSGQSQCASIYAKANSGSGIRLSAQNFDATHEVRYNLSTGAVDSTLLGAPDATGIEDLGGGWYRCWMSFTSTTDVVGDVFVYASDSGTTNTLTAGNTVYVWGAQTEQESYPTSYIKTVAATATRAAETCTIAAANLSYATSITFNLKGYINAPHDDGLSAQLMNWQAAGPHVHRMEYRLSGANTGAGASTIFGTGTVTNAEGVPGTIGFGHETPVNIAYRNVNASTLQTAVGGTAVTATAHALNPNPSASVLALTGGSTTYPWIISLFRLFDVDLGQSGIEAAST